MSLPLILAAAAQAAEPGLVEKFGLELKYVIWQVVSFLIVLGVLYKFGIKPVTATMEERNKKIESGIKHAEEMQRKLAATQEESAAILKKASVEATRIVEDARNEIARLVVTTTERVLAKKLTDADRAAYNESAARELANV